MPLNLIFIQPGNYTIEDNGIPGDNISVIKDGTGTVIFTFGHPADALGFTVSTPGVNLTVNFTDSMGAANFTVGSLTDPTQSPDSIVMENINTTGTVTLASNGTIGEAGDDPAADITAGAVVLSAATGIGTGTNAIETRTGLFEAETATGGVNVRNFGSVQIGGVVAEVDGLDVATSGDIRFTTVGSIFLTEANSVTAGEVVHGGATSGNVTLTATGFNADIIGNVDNGAVTVPRGSLTLTAGRDIQLGTIGSDFNNDIITNNALTMTAGRDILIDGFADILSDNFGLDTGGNMMMTAGRNIAILNLAGTSASVTASGSGGGDAILATGVGGTLTVNGPGSFALGSTSGDVIVRADRVLIDAASGISAPSGQVTLRPRTEGRETILGSASDAALAVELSDVELNRIFTPNLTIGSTAGGSLTVAAAIAMISAGNAPNLTLLTQDDLLLLAGITTTTSLTLRAGNSLFHTAGTISTATLLAQVDTAGNDGGTGGVGLLQGSINATSIALNGNAEADTLRGAEGVDQTVHGNGGNDTITSSGEGHYFGDGGNDRILAGLSSGLVPEVLDGGAGIDTLDTRSFNGAYTINLATGATNFGFESFVNFENVMTGDGSDTVTGSSGANLIQTGLGNDTLNGGAGNDTLNGGDGDDALTGSTGADALSGGAGVDRASYAGSNAGVTVNLATQTGAGGHAAGDTLVGIENLIGSAFADTLTGSASDNALLGGNGNDTINAGAGNDIVQGGAGVDTINGGNGNDVLAGQAGNDILVGGAGNDTFAFEAGGGSDTVSAFADDLDTLRLDDNLWGGGLTAAQVLANFATQNGPNSVVFDFGGGNVLTVNAGGITVAALENDIAII